jgi:hypothetical protein
VVGKARRGQLLIQPATVADPRPQQGATETRPPGTSRPRLRRVTVAGGCRWAVMAHRHTTILTTAVTVPRLTTMVNSLAEEPVHDQHTRHTVSLRCLAIISAAAAVIHFSVTGEHFQEYWLFGVFMVVIAWLQVLWAVLSIARPSRLLLGLGAGLNAAVVAVYVITRTVGDLVGPTPSAAEPFGFTDVLCTAFELVLVAGSAWLLLSGTSRRVSRGHALAALMTTAGVVAALLSASLLVATPEMEMDSADSATSGDAPMGMAASPIRLPTSSPAGDITMPDATMQMGDGMKMADPSPCDAVPTEEQQHAAVTLVDNAWRDAQKYQSLAAAQAAGYRPVTPSGKSVVHYVSPTSSRAALGGEHALDTADPPSLVYANTPHGAVLAAAMFMAPLGSAAPQPGGCLTQWHIHTNLCLSRGQVVVAETDAGCPPGSKNRQTPPMLHLWFVPIPGGPTAIDAQDAQIVTAAQRTPPGPANGVA